MSRIYWDTMLFVYWLEDHPQHSRTVQELFEKMDRRGDRLCTSAFTLGELLVGPHKQNALAVVQEIKDFFRTSTVELLHHTPDTAERYAQVRAAHRVSPADAIHLASAADAGVELFLTNDHRLRGLVVPGIHFIAGMDVNLF